jgi:uncharacterized membrane protein YeaQ/YmgE (transglycosylase-associated protein family)
VGIIAWILIGLLAGMIMTMLIGIAGGLLGGWIGAIVGSLILLAGYRTVTGRGTSRQACPQAPQDNASTVKEPARWLW